jgi:hypothetical protein
MLLENINEILQMGLAPGKTTTIGLTRDSSMLGKLLHRSVNGKYGR